ncbi:1,3-beta-glucan synthase subunit FKS1-like protein [Tanacetum coccineum]
MRQKELGQDPTAAKLFFRTHIKKDKKTFVDDEAKETYEQYMEKHGAQDTLDKKSGNIANTYIRWADHVGSKKGKFYGLPSGFNRHVFEQIVDSIG